MRAWNSRVLLRVNHTLGKTLNHKHLGLLLKLMLPDYYGMFMKKMYLGFTV